MRKFTAASLIGAAVGSVVLALPLSAQAASFGGGGFASASATGATIVVASLHRSIASTGSVSNGVVNVRLLGTPVGSPVALGVLTSRAQGNIGYSDASTSVATVLIPGVLAATAVTSSAAAACNSEGVVTTFGNSTLASLQGPVYPFVRVQAPPPNTTYSIPGGTTVVLNEQTRTINSIVVRAIHVHGPLGLDVIVGESTASVLYCAGPPLD